MQDDHTPPPDAAVSRALDAWAPLAPPADFVDRVLDARAPTAPAARSTRRRVVWLGGIAAAGAVAAALVLVVGSSHRAARGALAVSQRTTALIGARGTVVAEPASELTWRVDDDGAADVTQRTGNVFYRVERGGPFVVHTPAGDVRVTGTCFRIEVEPMTPSTKLLLAGLAGAAIASTVLITVYEGHVIADTRSARTELGAGSQATLSGADGTTVVAGTLATPTDDSHASREQLLVRTRAQQAQLNQLRARVALLENAARAAEAPGAKDIPEPGRTWHDPSPEKLAEWVADCHVRTDQPALDRFSPLTAPDKTLGIAAGELADYNAAMTEMAKQWKDLVRSLYIETTGDAAGADTLSSEAMRREIEDKSPRGEHNLILQRVSQERAGLAAPPADLSKASTLERLMRASFQLGDQSEAALAKRLGAERAHAIRGEGWGSRWELGGCPSSP
ncbi:MAG: FecR domain-containing protein [Deltaproteobacteria bacterium]|nr:MAG: FecR domain-containing protein [Deltaproteobacteria bacterium]TMQ18793.1 MAG: FecR domain-containing protein [Deltaproteobacteria bacterium]